MIERDHFIIYSGLADHPGKYVLKRVPQNSLRANFVVAHALLSEVRKGVPAGYANTGVPDGPFMVEVWVWQYE